MNIGTRLARLERRAGLRISESRDARVGRCLETLMADDAGRLAVIAFSNYCDRHHPNARANRAAFDADRKVAELYNAVLAEATRLNVVWWLDAG